MAPHNAPTEGSPAANRIGITNGVENLVVPNIQRLLSSCRTSRVEVIYLRIVSLLGDGRDMNPMQRRSKALVASLDSKEAQILHEIAPLESELIINKGSSGVFNGTAFDQILRNLGIENLIFCGVGTNYCVETSVRDAGDRSYNVVMVSDACAARNAEHERLAAEILDGVYCRMLTTDETLTVLAHEEIQP